MNEETALLQLTGDASVQQRFLEMSHLYDAAIREIRTRLEILDREFSILYASNPIHHIDSRLKSPQSIVEKLHRKGFPVTIESAEEHLFDIAGVRIICNYIDDIYRLAELITRQQDIELVEKCDYISEPKPNGYRSHHVIFGVNVCCLDANEYYPVEIQLRTISMDFWAAMEHRVSYKKQYDNKEQRVAELLQYSNILEKMEKEFEKYNDHPVEM